MSGENMQANPIPRQGADVMAVLANAGVPAKTDAGRAEITSRSRGLNQRQRTVLLLVDGRRTSAQIRHLAAQVGATEQCLDELAEIGLITLPAYLPTPPAMQAPIAVQMAPPMVMPVASITSTPTHAQVSFASSNPLSGQSDSVPMSAWVRPSQTQAQAQMPSPKPAPLPMPIPPAMLVRAAADAEPQRPASRPLISSPPPTAHSWPTRSAALPSIALTEFAPTHFFMPSLPVITIQEAPPRTIGVDADAETARRLTSELFDEFVRANQPPDEGPSTLGGAPLRSGRLDSMMSSLYPLLESAFGALSRSNVAAGATQDESLEEARRILLREVRSKAPVTGALTVVKLRRAASREEILALLDDVGTHISVPMRRLSTQQTLLNVRSLLERPM